MGNSDDGMTAALCSGDGGGGSDAGSPRRGGAPRARGGAGAGDASDSSSGSGGAAARAAARLNLLTLAISGPPGAEARFWREAGTPAYASTDRTTLVITAFNVAAHCYGAWSRAFAANRGGPPPPLVMVVLGPFVAPALIVAAVAARVLLSARPRAYARNRTWMAVAQRLGRTVPQVVSGPARRARGAARARGGAGGGRGCKRSRGARGPVCRAPPCVASRGRLPTPNPQAGYWYTAAYGWEGLLGGPVAAAGAADAAGAAGDAADADAAAYSLVGLRPFGLAVFPAMHSGLFPLPLRLQAPIQLLACALTAPGAWGLICAVRARAAALAAARRACGVAAAARGALVVLADGGASLLVAGGGRACAEAPMEYLLVLAFSLSALLTVRRAPRAAAGCLGAPRRSWGPGAARPCRVCQGPCARSHPQPQPPPPTPHPPPPPPPPRSCTSMSGSWS
jgi:hypothetical protein